MGRSSLISKWYIDHLKQESEELRHKQQQTPNKNSKVTATKVITIAHFVGASGTYSIDRIVLLRPYSSALFVYPFLFLLF